MTEINKWKDKWFRALNPTEKILFIYLIENCDNAGFIEVDCDLWAFQIGLDENEISESLVGLKKSVEVVGDWCWIVNFLKYQRNLPLNPQNNAHKQIINILNDNKNKFISSVRFKEFLGANEGLISPPVTYSKGNVDILSKKEQILNSKIWIEQICMKKKIENQKCLIYLGTFLDDLELKNDFAKDENEIKSHFVNWLTAEIKKPQPKDVGYKM